MKFFKNRAILKVKKAIYLKSIRRNKVIFMNEETDLQKNISEIVKKYKTLAIEIEVLVNEQLINFGLFREDESLNEYKKRVRDGMETLLKDKSLLDEQRIKLSQYLLNLIKVYQDGFIDNLKKTNNDLLAKIIEFRDDLKTFLSGEEIKAPREFLNDLVEWVRLSMETYNALKMMEDSITKQVELDKFFPDKIIKDNGKINQSMSELEKKEYAESVGTYGALEITAANKYKEIKETRNSLTKKIFGDIQKELDKKLTDWPKKLKKQMLSKKKGFFKGLFQ